MTASPDITLNPSELEDFYNRYFSYYLTLAAPAKVVFIKRCLQFISDKEITGAEGFELDNRVKALVAASAVQLTLGLETWQLNYFEEIEIHPSTFDSASGDLKFSGETNLQGYIKLSWKSFINGYKISDDNINLGLHEFSHALRFNSIRGNEQDYFVDNYFNKWMACAYEAFYDIKNNKKTIFRKYGGANINEFLSVCIEHYFESPEEIKENYPVLYYATAILLNQCTLKNKTRIGIRAEFFSEKSKLLQGFSKQNMQSHFLKHWTFKLWIFVSAVLLFNSTTRGVLNPVTLALALMVVSIYLWYDFNAVKITFDGMNVSFEKGAFLFKKRKIWHVAVSQLISLREDSEEWCFTYYKNEDAFFYEEKLDAPKELQEIFLKECRENKIALLK